MHTAVRQTLAHLYAYTRWLRSAMAERGDGSENCQIWITFNGRELLQSFARPGIPEANLMALKERRGPCNKLRFLGAFHWVVVVISVDCAVLYIYNIIAVIYIYKYIYTNTHTVIWRGHMRRIKLDPHPTITTTSKTF